MAAPIRTRSSATIRRCAPSSCRRSPDESGDDLALWLGTSDREYETVYALHAAARSRGFDVMPLPDDIAARLSAHVAAEARRPPHDGPLAALLRHLQSK